MKRLTDPCENLRCYIMVHGGIDRHERLLDVEWIEDVIQAARQVRTYSGPTNDAQARLNQLLSE